MRGTDENDRLLKKFIKPYGYSQCKQSTCQWKWDCRWLVGHYALSFILCV